MNSKGYFSYTRVSTAKQGQVGTSLAEQRAAIQQYTERWNLRIIREFEEKETAAKLGRPVFADMLKALKRSQARGVVIHKIDRSARNLKDWAELGDLIDQGIEVHFANENLDLYSRGGRLSADIQAVVAADYIRNLREEVKKGFYGRIRQGLYPMPAPVGYTDQGGGKRKEIDPIQGPMVRQAFELYATGKWPIRTLIEKMHALGLRNRRGGKVSKNGMAKLLHNIFYIGVIRVKAKGEMFPGTHTPLIPKALFERVQSILAGKKVEKQHQHFFLFRKLLHCASCNATLIGEIQKKHCYYRCQIKQCAQKSIREEAVETALIEVLNKLSFNDNENRYIHQLIKEQYQNAAKFKEAQTKALALQLEQLRSRLSKLTDVYIDGTLEKELYLEKKNSLVVEERAVKERLNTLDEAEQKILQRVEQFLELVNSFYLSYKLATPEEKRDLVKIVTSNFEIEGKTVLIKLNYPFQIIADRQKDTCGGPQRGLDRTMSLLLGQLCVYFENHELSLQADTNA